MAMSEKIHTYCFEEITQEMLDHLEWFRISLKKQPKEPRSGDMARGCIFDKVHAEIHIHGITSVAPLYICVHDLVRNYWAIRECKE